eukprot:COSAG02_NODE_488_length_21256_cov_9.406579_14_plen_103_part_00
MLSSLEDTRDPLLACSMRKHPVTPLPPPPPPLWPTQARADDPDWCSSHAWFGAAVGPSDREVMPWQLVEQLLRDSAFRPGPRPAQIMLPAGRMLPRAQRIFK